MCDCLSCRYIINSLGSSTTGRKMSRTSCVNKTSYAEILMKREISGFDSAFLVGFYSTGLCKQAGQVQIFILN